MILPCDVASSHVSSSSSSSSIHPRALPSSLSAPSAALFASMDHQQQSPEQLMAQYAAHVLRQHQQQAKPYSRRTPAAKPYSCEQCGRGFKYLHTLRFHIKTTHDSAAPAVEPRLSRLRRDAQPATDLSSGTAFCGEPPDAGEGREEDLLLPPSHARADGSSSRSEPDVPPEFPQDVASLATEREPPSSANKEEPEGYGVVQSESQDVPTTTTSCVGGRMSLAAAGLPPPLLGMEAWRSMKLQAEVPLASKVDVVNPLTEQQYTLYKCGICGETQPSVRGLCEHLQAHARAVKEHHCDKCGAVFKWRSQLAVHEQVHQVMEGKAGLPPAGLPVLNPLPDALIGEPRVSFDQALQLGALAAGHFLQPGALPNIAMSLPLTMPGTTSVAPSSTSSMPEFTSHAPPPPPRASVGSKGGSGGASSCPSSSQEAGMRLPFQCSYCSKSFDRIFSLQRHERIHTGVKPCYCKACGRGFSERRNLRHHIIRFHSDVSQRDQLRRRRRAAAARSRAAAAPAGGANGGVAASGCDGDGDLAGNPQGSLKLVSFLKKTAVHMLNSVDESKEEDDNDEDDLEDMDDLEDKADGDLDDEDDMRAGDDGGFTENGSPDGFKEDHRMDGSNPELSEDEGPSPLAPEMPVALCLKDSGSPSRSVEAERKVDEEEGEEDNKTIIYPLEHVPMAAAPAEAAQMDEKNSADVPLSSQDLDASNEELRRPTTGNRRKKGRPMRYGPAVVETTEDCDNNKTTEEGAGESKESGDETSDERAAEDDVNPYSKEEMAAWMQLGKAAAHNPGRCENGEIGSHDNSNRVGTASHGPFLSAYNQRLDTAERPSVGRDEACTPQIGPDGKFVYPCSYCYKTFSSTSDLNRHMDFHEAGNCSFKLI